MKRSNGTMDKKQDKLKRLLAKIPCDIRSVKYGHVLVGYARWFNRELT